MLTQLYEEQLRDFAANNLLKKDSLLDEISNINSIFKNTYTEYNKRLIAGKRLNELKIVDQNLNRLQEEIIQKSRNNNINLVDYSTKLIGVIKDFIVKDKTYVQSIRHYKSANTIFLERLIENYFYEVDKYGWSSEDYNNFRHLAVKVFKDAINNQAQLKSVIDVVLLKKEYLSSNIEKVIKCFNKTYTSYPKKYWYTTRHADIVEARKKLLELKRKVSSNKNDISDSSYLLALLYIVNSFIVKGATNTGKKVDNKSANTIFITYFAKTFFEDALSDKWNIKNWNDNDFDRFRKTFINLSEYYGVELNKIKKKIDFKIELHDVKGVKQKKIKFSDFDLLSIIKKYFIVNKEKFKSNKEDLPEEIDIFKDLIKENLPKENHKDWQIDKWTQKDFDKFRSTLHKLYNEYGVLVAKEEKQKTVPKVKNKNLANTSIIIFDYFNNNNKPKPKNNSEYLIKVVDKTKLDKSKKSTHKKESENYNFILDFMEIQHKNKKKDIAKVDKSIKDNKNYRNKDVIVDQDEIDECAEMTTFIGSQQLKKIWSNKLDNAIFFNPRLKPRYNMQLAIKNFGLSDEKFNFVKNLINKKPISDKGKINNSSAPKTSAKSKVRDDSRKKIDKRVELINFIANQQYKKILYNRLDNAIFFNPKLKPGYNMQLVVKDFGLPEKDFNFVRNLIEEKAVLDKNDIDNVSKSDVLIEAKKRELISADSEGLKNTEINGDKEVAGTLKRRKKSITTKKELLANYFNLKRDKTILHKSYKVVQNKKYRKILDKHVGRLNGLLSSFYNPAKEFAYYFSYFINRKISEEILVKRTIGSMTDWGMGKYICNNDDLNKDNTSKHNKSPNKIAMN